MELQPMDVDDSVEAQNDNSSNETVKKGFSVCCKNAMKNWGTLLQQQHCKVVLWKG